MDVKEARAAADRLLGRVEPRAGAVPDVEADADPGIELRDPVADRPGGGVAEVARTVVVDSQPDAGFPHSLFGPAEERVVGDADDDPHAAGPGVGESPVDLGLGAHVDNAAAVGDEAEGSDLVHSRPDLVVRAVERQMHVLQGDPAEAEPPGHRQRLVEPEFPEGVGG